MTLGGTAEVVPYQDHAGHRVLTRREAHRLIRFLHPDAGRIEAVVDSHFHDHSRAATTAFAGGADFVSLDQPPLTAGPPVGVKLSERILWVFLRMLLPQRILHPDAVSRLEVLLLDGCEKLVRDVFFRPVAIEPEQESGNN